MRSSTTAFVLAVGLLGCSASTDPGAPVGGEGVVGDRGDDSPPSAADRPVPVTAEDSGAGPPTQPDGGPVPVDLDGPPSPANALARARTAVGFSYWWGGGAWLGEGSTPATAGSCSGSCPSCSHSGKYGADCSGMVAKAWQFGAKALPVNAHPYSTASFVGASSNWSTVSRGALRGGDALVYNTNGAGHIALYEKGDAWGSPTVYECRGCSYGCVHDTRSFSAAYAGIRRTGF